ncbi:MAG: PKD domain-containing protein [Ferruginibacter sp.]
MIKHLLLILCTVGCQFLFGQSTDFSFQGSSSNCLPADIQFTQTSTGSPVGYLWDFGNGTRSNLANPITTYTSPGVYTVRLITVYENNTAQKTRNVVIHPSITASFNYDRSYLCQPGTVNFTASSSGSLSSYIWDFGDGSAPVTGTSNTIAHNYTSFGEFAVTFQAVSTTGCIVSDSRIVKVVKPEISGTITTPLTGCVPMTTDLRATVSVPASITISNYLWNFGDGSSLTTTGPTISHDYTQVGAYSPTVTVTTTEGCTNIFRYDSLFFGRPPTNLVAYPLDTVYCGSDIAEFVSVATDANRYDWNFTGGNSITSVTETTAHHKYTSLGFKDVSVTPVFNGCRGTTTGFQIEIIGVIAKFKYANTCNDKKTFLFDNTSVGNISTINWSLGNQGYSTNPDTVSHTYPQSGIFGIKLLITDNITGCIDSFKTKIYTANPVMKNNDQSICINTDSHFSIINNYSNPNLTYLWNVLAQEIGPSPDAAPIVHSDSLGHFNSQAILDNGPQYCPDTIHLDHIITVRGPQLDFTAPESLCLNIPLSVVNLSHPFQASDTVNLWYWNFGRVESNDTSFQPQPYTYNYPKNYRVKLVAVDVTGCTDSLIKKVTMRPMPFLWIIPKFDTVCEGQNTTLIGYTSDDILWSPGIANICPTCDTATMAPLQTTRYYATATNNFNCVATDSALVKVFNPFNAAPLTADTSFCGGGSIRLDVEPRGKVVTWTPAVSLSSSNIYNPVASPKQTTIYKALLTDSAGCFSSEAQIRLVVKSTPTVNAGPDKVYPYNATFALAPSYSSNIRTWLWSPADSLSCAACPDPITTAIRTKTYTVKVISDSGCIAQDRITIFVECNGANLFLPGAFTPNNDNRNDIYRPITRGIQYIKRFAIFNREGQLVYEMKNYTPNKENIGWDGRFRGKEQSPAGYVYLVEAICDIGETIFSKGSFILIR